MPGDSREPYYHVQRSEYIQPEIIDCQDRGSSLKFVAKFKNQIRTYYAHADTDGASGLVHTKRTDESSGVADDLDAWRCGLCGARIIGGDSCVVCLR